MPKELTSKQEHFAQLVASGLNHTDAYRQAYDTSASSPPTVSDNAYTLSLHTEVAPRIAELKAIVTKAAEAELAWTLTDLVREAKQNLEGARESKQWASANGAIEWIGRATGLVSDKPAPQSVTVTKIIINLAPGVEMPERIVEASEYHDVEEESD